ncbi:MAG: pyruvate ferredoxin oxidoreductase [Sulfolobales archaeon]|jgi:pyruvate ferredoxin oxidoreductase alpha subunit
MRTNRKVEPLSGNYAVAYAVKSVDVDVISAYPITPQTTIVEKLAEFVANGELDAEYLHVESEHSAMSAAIGAAATGARVFTATSSQGLALMYETLFIASGMRLPIVMALVTRALSAPINIWNDHSDLMASQDTGWIQLVSTNNQEAYDLTIMAYKLSEHNEISLPTMVALDGYIQSHTIEPVQLEDEELVRKFVPKRKREYILDPEKPISMGNLGDPDWYYEFKVQQVEAMERVKRVFREINNEFKSLFNRSYEPFEVIYGDDADTILVVMGAHTGTFIKASKIARSEGVKVGIGILRMLRPFPDEVVKYLSQYDYVGVADKSIHFGSPSGSYLANDISTALHLEGSSTRVATYIYGIGGRVLRLEDALFIIRNLWRVSKRLEEYSKKPVFVGVRY